MAKPASALTLQEAIRETVATDPDILASIENREAIEFELRQARGLYLPQLDVESSIGARRLDNDGRRATGDEGTALFPRDIGLSLNQNVFDGFGREAEVERQASRVDGASFRVYERSEFIGLEVTREYVELLLQDEIIEEAKKNVRFHRAILSDIREGVNSGTLTSADLEQGIERLLGAESRLIEAQEDRAIAAVRLQRYVNRPVHKVAGLPHLNHYLPKTRAQAVALARQHNPLILLAMADVDTAAAELKAAKAPFYPRLNLEGLARTGQDIDGDDDRTTDLQVRLALRWNIYRGGIDTADVQEQIRRVGEARKIRDLRIREVEENVRAAWITRTQQRVLLAKLKEQAAANNDVVSSYREQFRIGLRSLLDLLDAQNTRFNTNVLVQTSNYSAAFADFRLVAATGRLLDAVHTALPPQADAYARADAHVPPPPKPKEMPRKDPNMGRIEYFRSDLN
ncbi:TolC family outer membrane protein [Pseudovibrio sp. SPO723]|uniref:TolC family outer membrane protein n=1 Tax=Nesiotobacter zosterae TaxID=392721 RepID=UPI0029C4CC46|nr:TolC family outer membrane protein [Pseudovibrio sp. SPO723]MDX5591934.1 TolC family outer membrane protein [Pseudovibrio sp. SPO723]